MNGKMASVVIPVWNGRRHLSACLDALLAQDWADLEVIAVDNASSDGSADFMATNYAQVHLVRNRRNLGFAGGCNCGLRAARGDVLVLLNQDAIVQAGWLGALVSALADEQVGIVGAKLLAPDGHTLSHAGACLEWPPVQGRHIGMGEIDEGQYDVAADVEYVTGASLAVRRAVLDRIGLLDERFYPAFFEDVDLCWRARRAGWRVRYDPRAVVVHDEGSSTRHHWPSRHYYHYRNRLLFLFKHFAPSRILAEFVPAERECISSLPADQLRAGRLALTEILAAWPSVAVDLSASDTPARDVEELRESLRALRALIVRKQGSDPALTMPRSPDGGEEIDRPSTTALAKELETLWEVRERPFASRVPIVGGCIVAFRNLWNSVAAKWYVRPLLSQQVQFNGAVTRALGAVTRALAALLIHSGDDDALLAMLAERCGVMGLRIAELEARLAQLEEQVGETGHG